MRFVPPEGYEVPTLIAMITGTLILLVVINHFGIFPHIGGMDIGENLSPEELIEFENAMKNAVLKMVIGTVLIALSISGIHLLMIRKREWRRRGNEPPKFR